MRLADHSRGTEWHYSGRFLLVGAAAAKRQSGAGHALCSQPRNAMARGFNSPGAATGRLERSSVGCMNFQHVEREDRQVIGAMQERPLKPPK